MAVKKLPDIVTSLFRMRFRREVAGVTEVYLCIRNIALPGFSTCGYEKRILLSQDRQQGRRRRSAGLAVKNINISCPLVAVVLLRRRVICSR